MEAVATREEQISCPCCNKTDTVNNVLSIRAGGSQNVTYRKFCKECLIEFTRSGTIVPPIWE